jgi:GT2 family glycosyltransferase
MRCSIVIATLGRSSLPAVLAALDGQGHETIVVDDGGGGVAEATLRTPRVGGAAARNAGARAATGELLAFLDDDATPARDWVARLVAAAEANPGAAIGGSFENGLPADAYATAAHVILAAGYEWSARHGIRFFASLNLAVPRDGFLALGGFDERFARGADREFCDRWLASGRSLVAAPDARVSHAQDLTWRTFWRKHAANGRFLHEFHREHAARNRRGPALDTGYYALLARRAAAEGPRVAALVAAALVANYGAYAVARAAEAARA